MHFYFFQVNSTNETDSLANFIKETHPHLTIQPVCKNLGPFLARFSCLFVGNGSRNHVCVTNPILSFASYTLFVCVRVLRPSQQRGHVEPVS